MDDVTSMNRLPTLYPTYKESSRAISIGIDLLINGDIETDEKGFCLIEDLCNKIKEKDSSFGYLNRNHIIEFFFKDTRRKILISGRDKIKYKNIRYVQPPQTLYFGTINSFSYKMRKYGIRSNTKGYIKLYETPEKACEFAQKFVKRGEETIAIAIDAEKAFSEGLKFSTFIDGEYIVVQLNKRYILSDNRN